MEWSTEFCCGHTSTNDVGCSNEVTFEEIVDKIYNSVLDDYQVKIHKIAKMINIRDMLFNILN